MNTVVTSLDSYQPSHSSAFQSALSPEALARASSGGLCRRRPRANERLLHLHLDRARAGGPGFGRVPAG